MPDPIKLSEVRRLQQQGADIQHQPREVIVKGLEAIANKLGHDDLLTAVKDLTEVISKKDTGGLEVEIDPVDFAPLIKVLQERKPPRYKFEIVRNNRGQMESVIAEPINGD